jgi:hypothetical protein
MTLNWTFFLIGAFGALIRDLVKDRTIDLPKLKDEKLYLGCIGGMLIGAFVGSAVDQNLIVAGLAGYTGTSIIDRLITKVNI